MTKSKSLPRSTLDRLRKGRGLYPIAACEMGDGARELEDAVVGASRQV